MNRPIKVRLPLNSPEKREIMRRRFCCYYDPTPPFGFTPIQRSPNWATGTGVTNRVFTTSIDGSPVTVSATRVDVSPPPFTSLVINQAFVMMPGWSWTKTPNPDGTHNYNIVFTPSDPEAPIGLELSIPVTAAALGQRIARVTFDQAPLFTQDNAVLNPDGSWTPPEYTGTGETHLPFVFRNGPLTMSVYNVEPGNTNIVGMRLWDFAAL